jgi:GTPase SAR1 family protein
MNTLDLKIILSGLDNAGKSSMLLALKKMYGFEEEVKQLKPTIRIDYYRRNFLNHRLNFFDMGGQSKFREAYLKRPIYFESVNVLIYLIDIQDDKRFSESIEYLGNVLNVLEEVDFDKSNPIYLCYSKADYELIQSNMIDYLSRMKMIKDWVEKTYSSYKFEYYSTSIYNLYSIVRMISNGLIRFVNGYDALEKIMRGFGENNNVKQALLFDHTGLVIADYFRGEGEGMELQNKIDGIISGHLEFFGQLEDQQLSITTTRSTDGQYMNVCYQFQLGFDDMEEEKVEQFRKAGDPYYSNYYFSMILPIDDAINGENQIPGTIEKVQEVLKSMLKKEDSD